MKTFTPTAITLALLAMVGAAHAQSNAELGRVTVTGEGDKLGTGLIVNEEAPKAKSSVTKAQLEKMRPTSNPFQALQYLPGVNANSQDATGLFGGSLRVRGFNSDQMGFTVNGAPVNDSGNFAVYPQEYVDGENLCELYVTQGATDNEAPHVGASGGNVGISTCAPIEQRRVRVTESIGQLGFNRTFVRVDTGRVGDFKGMISASKAYAAKWRGNGAAKRDHIDAAMEYRLPHDATISASLLYNRAVNNNFASNTLLGFAQQGYYADYSLRPPVHQAPSPGVAQPSPDVALSPLYNGYALNPFKNGLASAKLSMPITPALTVDVMPYFWYGFGNGGVSTVSLNESAATGATTLGGGLRDINLDGDNRDTGVLAYRASVTATYRPGVTTQFTYTLPGNTITGGFWYERARHRQTQPASVFGNFGNVGDIWLANNAALVHRQDGSLYQGRDQLTLSTGKAVFLSDKIDLYDNKIQITPALSWRQINRDFANYPNEGTGAGGYYKINQTFNKLLPSLAGSFKFAPGYQAFASVTKNMRVPSNFELQGAYSATAPGNVNLVNKVKPEYATNVDVGLRFQGQDYTAGITAFHTAFKDRIFRTSPDGVTNIDTNVGPSAIRGLEVEAGTKPYKGFSGYGSVTYTESVLKSNLVSSSTGFYNTANKQFPDTPSLMSSLVGQWAQGPWMVNVAMKYTGNRNLTLTNDVQTGGYTLWDLNAAYQLPNLGFVKSPLIRLNVSNIFSKRYYLANVGSGTNLTAAQFATSIIGSGGALGTPQVYTGAPRFSSVTFQADF